MDRVKLEARTRQEVGRKDARALRASGDIPGVIYRSGGDATPIAVAARDLRQAVTTGGRFAIMDVMVDSAKKPRTAIIKDMQVDAVRDRVVHVDFHEIPLDQKISTVVAVRLEGFAPGVNMGGVLQQPAHQINISVLPTEIPSELTLDISNLEMGGTLRLSDLTVPEGIEVLDDPEGTVLASVVAPISEEELLPEGEEEAEELAEGEEAGEGEEAAEGEGGGEEAPAEE